MFTRSQLAHVLHQVGLLVEASAEFRNAEEHEKRLRPQTPLLYSIWGLWFANLLLDQKNYKEVLRRVRQTIIWAGEGGGGLDDIAIEHLSFGLAYLAQIQVEGIEWFDQAAEHLRLATEGLRQTGQLDLLPLGLMALAELFSVKRELSRAQTHLDKAMSIATRGDMGLYKAECHLGFARVYLALSENEIEPMTRQERVEKARESLATAKGMIERMSYHRRDKDVKEIEAQLAQAS